MSGGEICRGRVEAEMTGGRRMCGKESGDRPKKYKKQKDCNDEKQEKRQSCRQRKSCVLLQVLCSSEVRTRCLHRPTHQMSLQTHSRTGKNRNTMQYMIVCVSVCDYLCMCRSSGSPQHRYLLLAELILTGSHM